MVLEDLGRHSGWGLEWCTTEPCLPPPWTVTGLEGAVGAEWRMVWQSLRSNEETPNHKGWEFGKVGERKWSC